MASVPIYHTFRHQSHVLVEALQNEKESERDFDNSYEDECAKKTRQKEFIDVTDFQRQHIPPSFRNQDGFMEYVLNAIDRTVNIKISYTSKNRPDTFPCSKVPYPFVKFRGSIKSRRCGTGYLEECSGLKEINRDEPCLCKFCKMSEEIKTTRWEFKVSTSSHLVWDKEEAESSIFELHYDSEDREMVKYLYGIDVLGDEHERYLTDYCQVTCVTHDEELGKRLRQFCDSTAKILLPRDCGNWNSSTGILISHPHGTCKKISVGNIQHRCLLRHPRARSMVLHKGRYCRLPARNTDEEGKQSSSTRESSNTDKRNAHPSYNTEILFKNTKVLNRSSEGEDISQLAIDVKVVLPEGAAFHMRRRIKDDSMHWYVFPSDTKFISLEDDGMSRMNIPFSENMEFYMPNVQATCKNEHKTSISWYLTYDMASCPGSSGARVLDLFRPNNHQPFHHFGSYPEFKVSGLIRGYYFVPRAYDPDDDDADC